MNKYYLAFLFSVIAVQHVHAQTKPAFGFLVKTGSYALPAHNQKPSFNYSADGSIIQFRQKPGEMYTIGIWYAQPLGKRLSILSELTFNYSIDRMESNQRSHLPDGSSFAPYYILLRQMTIERGFSLPVKLQYRPPKHPKWSFAAGAGFSHPTFARFNRFARYQVESIPVHNSTWSKRYTSWDDFSLLFNLLADIHFKIDKKTSIGLDYRYQKSSENYREGLIVNFGFVCDCDCSCDGYSTQVRPTMHSFSVSLRHKILN